MFHGLRQWWHYRRHKQDYEKKWPELPVRHLVYYYDDPEEGAFIVFLDWEGDLDWNRDEKAVASVTSKDDNSRISGILNEVALLEPRIMGWPRDLKISINCMLGESIARAFACDHQLAREVLEHTRSRIREKSQEVSRYWTLQACFAGAGIAGVALVVGIWQAPAIVGAIGRTPHLLSLSFCCGAIGSLLSIIMRLGKVCVDASAERRLHFAEGFARIVAGGIAGVVIGAMVKLGMVLPVFSQASMTALATCAAAMLGGASERLVPGIIAKIEAEESQTKGRTQ